LFEKLRSTETEIMNKVLSCKKALVCVLSCMTLVSFTAEKAGAAIAVDWGGTYGSQAFGNAAAEDFATTYGSGIYASVSTLKDGPRNLTPTSGYTAPEGKSSTFWGGWMASTPDATSEATIPGSVHPGTDSPLQAWDNNRGIWADRISIGVARYQARLRGMIYFSKSDFLNDLNSTTVAFDENSSLSFSGITDGNFGPNVRWVIQDGDTWYVSSAQGVGEYNKVFTLTLEDPNSALWAAFEPYSNDTYNAAPDSGYATHTFSNIQAVGMFFDSYGLASRNYDGDGWARFAMQSFTMEASAVPEPSIAGLAGVTLVSFGIAKLGSKITKGNQKKAK
jgi:hypothetical protein